MTCRILKAAGHKLIEQERPNLVFLDLVISEMDGLTVLKVLKEQASLIPVIRAECLALGAVALINKAPKEEEVLHVLQMALAKKGLA